MDSETAKFDERLAALERDVAVIKSNYVTKADLHGELGSLKSELLLEMNRQSWRFITFMTGVCAVLVSATYFIATHAK
jgi:hypothetical protein